jgi:capsular polysaccharide transport system permease protein
MMAESAETNNQLQNLNSIEEPSPLTTEAPIEMPMESASHGGIKRERRNWLALLLSLLISGGVLAAGLYYIWGYVPKRYESKIQATLQTTVAGMADGGELGTVLGVPGYYAQEISIIQQFVQSPDLYKIMNDAFKLNNRFRQYPVEWHLKPTAKTSTEDFVRIYETLFRVHIDPASGIITFKAQDVDPTKAKLMAQFMLDETETFINSLSNEMSGKKQALAKQYVSYYEKRRAEVEENLSSLQDEYGVVVPEQELKMKQGMINQLGSELAKLKLELTALQAYQQQSAPQVQAKLEEIAFLQSEIAKLKDDVVSVASSNPLNKASIKFQHVQQEMEFWNKNLNAMQRLNEVASIEEQHQMKYLTVVTTPQVHEKSTHPKVWLWSLVVLAASLVVYGASHGVLTALFRPKQNKRV